MHAKYVVAVFAIFAVFTIYIVAQARSKGSIEIGNQMARWGVMSAQDFYRIDDIQTKIEHGGKVTDHDLDFGIHILESPAPNQRQTFFRRLQAVTYTTSMYDHWTAKQRDENFAAALWLLDQPEPKDQVNGDSSLTTDKIPAIMLLGCVGEQREVP